VTSDDGRHEVIAEEYAVLDRAGRVQLPRGHVAQLGLRDRVQLRLQADHVGIWPDRPGADGAASGAGEPAAGDPAAEAAADEAAAHDPEAPA
jgi:hypothetical protein